MCELFTAITRETTNVLIQAHEPHRFFQFRRWGMTRAVDGAREKTGRRNVALESEEARATARAPNSVWRQRWNVKEKKNGLIDMRAPAVRSHGQLDHGGSC
ncbi:hypothetical protein AVEN_145477-1 [Araneus ventricosus]|uniref:Uncharacterized protein n=1 Tax=Araneus ventricosus TaxID=182803 RepID=A0A4Y2TGJ2_ARAVE|nr:hypothetical protein AVEN_145477-1 [Araneus ventricosus]